MLHPWFVTESPGVVEHIYESWNWIRVIAAVALTVLCYYTFYTGQGAADTETDLPSNDEKNVSNIQTGPDDTDMGPKFFTGVYRVSMRFMGVTETVDFTLSKPRNVKIHSTGRFGTHTYYTTYTWKRGIMKVKDIPETGMRVQKVKYDKKSDAFVMTVRSTWLWITKTVTAKRYNA